MLSCHFLCKKVTKELAKSKRSNHASPHMPYISARVVRGCRNVNPSRDSSPAHRRRFRVRVFLRQVTCAFRNRRRVRGSDGVRFDFS